MKSRIENPLTIVAVFASLVEIAGTTVIALLPVEIQKIFIWFVIIFPILLVILFFLTWNFNNKVLYPPNQFKDEKHFMELNHSTEKIYEKLISISSSVKDEEARSALDEVLYEFDNNLLKEEQTEGLSEISDNKKLITIEINGVLVSGLSVKELYTNVMNFLYEQRIDIDSYVPYATGYKRYLISKNNRHINGDKFVSPLPFNWDSRGKYYLEAHKSKIGARNDIVKFLNHIGLIAK